MRNIEECHGCYANANEYPDNWFTKPCLKPHLVLWAKKANKTFWPAKMIKIYENWIVVQYFGDHEIANVTDCLLYSSEKPSYTNLYDSNKYTEVSKVSILFCTYVN